MNSDQIQSAIRTALQIVGMVATTQGWISATNWSVLTADALAAVGPVMVLGAAIWGLYSHTASAKIAAVNATPGVKVVSQNSPGIAVDAAPKS